MWILTFTNWHKTCSIRPLCVRFNVTDFLYLLNAWEEDGQFYYSELHILQGSEQNIASFFTAMKKDPSIVRIEKNGNQITTLNRRLGEADIYAPVVNPKLIYVKPVKQRPDGFEEWELAAWDKEILMDVLRVSDFDVKIKRIEQRPLTDLFIPHIQPKLPPKQKEALYLAVEEGYYHYPRSIHLEGLAAFSKTTRATLQENLRRAESRIIPYLSEKTKI